MKLVLWSSTSERVQGWFLRPYSYLLLLLLLLLLKLSKACTLVLLRRLNGLPAIPAVPVDRLPPSLWRSDVRKENARSWRGLKIQKWVVEKQKANAR
jgi:hypothetical protein